MQCASDAFGDFLQVLRICIPEDTGAEGGRACGGEIFRGEGTSLLNKGLRDFLHGERIQQELAFPADIHEVGQGRIGGISEKAQSSAFVDIRDNGALQGAGTQMKGYMIETAERYIASGLSVLPTNRSSKTPMLENWRRLQSNRLTRDECERAFYPD